VLLAGRDLLNHPPISVRIGEEGDADQIERLPFTAGAILTRVEYEDLTHVHASLDEVFPRGLNVGDKKEQASREPGFNCSVPGPKWIEHAEPGGVSCRKRTSSVTWWSMSTLKPICSA
jgi:hypothetical protein